MNIFDKIRITKPRKNKFDLSHEKKMSLNMGNLIPMLVNDIVPGDSFRVNSEILIRFAPMLAPIMHRVNVFTHYFFVPNRLVWDEWEDFITGGATGLSEPVPPYITINSTSSGLFAKGTLPDYMGIPVPPQDPDPVQQTVDISALPFRAYQLIYDEYYRDPTLSDPSEFAKTSGAQPFSEASIICAMRKRSWEKDYFTSALPEAQRGGSVGSPVTGSVGAGTFRTGDVRKNSDNTLATGDLTANLGVMSAGADNAYQELTGSGELTDASMQITELRRAIRLQEWLEKNARGGYRYIEQILSHFGVRSSDARLQRPEYLGGGKVPVVISEVLSTFQQTAEGVPQGNMAGHGVSVGNTNGFSKTFEEHGYVIGIMSIIPKTAYQQGVPRHFSRFDKFDYYWPEFANIGEQEILNQELYMDYASVTPNKATTFGYQSRYAEYKYCPSTVHGDFLDNLSYWHMGRIFEAIPSLNQAFIEADPTQRIFAVTDPDEHKLYCQIYNSVSALRPMPYFGTPTL